MELAPKNNLFHEDSYDTPQNMRNFSDKLLLGSRLHFYWRNFDVFRRTGQTAKKGLLDAENQVFFSNQNFRITEECGGLIHLRGLNHLREMENRPCVIVANHMSLLETGILHAIMRNWLDFSFVIKESLFGVPFFGDIMRSLNAVGVSRTNPREDFRAVLEKGEAVLSAGRSLVIFPQSTRSVEFLPEMFNTIGIKLAKNAGVPVLPLALKTDFVSPGRLVKDLGPVKRDRQIYFEYDAPLTISGNGKDEHKRIIEFIQTHLNEWNAAEGR